VPAHQPDLPVAEDRLGVERRVRAEGLGRLLLEGGGVNRHAACGGRVDADESEPADNDQEEKTKADALSGHESGGGDGSGFVLD
jgi:hypothetical protein